MKQKWMIPMLAMALVACSSEDDLQTNFGKGQITFEPEVSTEIAQIETRATSGYALPSELIPAGEDFVLAIAGTYVDANDQTQNYAQSWTSVAAFNLEKPDLQAGTYTATFTYGDPAAEGVACPYFAGELVDFAVKASKTTTYPVSCKLANSCFTLQVSEWMLNYYDEIQLTIHTATNDFSYTMNSTEVTTLTFICPEQSLSFSGTAIKSQNGVAVEFPKTTIGTSTVAAETLYAISVDHGTAGAGSLTITFDDSFTEVAEVEVELNPDVE